ncbi:predicted protein [Botrytis cinerea T4]|uniref:Uncharacterized protein n=1 Tax=Botryotinia fuckeliana (strain T4) TaxID=999810 RepID=G2YNE0_BOTF4|nr:predicted protein [Botrytis cinerea T4]
MNNSAQQIRGSVRSLLIRVSKQTALKSYRGSVLSDLDIQLRTRVGGRGLNVDGFINQYHN